MTSIINNMTREILKKQKGLFSKALLCKTIAFSMQHVSCLTFTNNSNLGLISRVGWSIWYFMPSISFCCSARISLSQCLAATISGTVTMAGWLVRPNRFETCKIEIQTFFNIIILFYKLLRHITSGEVTKLRYNLIWRTDLPKQKLERKEKESEGNDQATVDCLFMDSRSIIWWQTHYSLLPCSSWSYWRGF